MMSFFGHSPPLMRYARGSINTCVSNVYVLAALFRRKCASIGRINVSACKSVVMLRSECRQVQMRILLLVETRM